MLLGVDFLLHVLPLLLAAAGTYRLPVWLRARTKVTIVYVLKVFGHGVLVVAVHSVFLLRPVGVISILCERRARERDEESVEYGKEKRGGGRTQTRKTRSELSKHGAYQMLD